MDVEFTIIFISLGFVSGIIAGLMGISGAVITIPLILYVLPSLGHPELDVQTTAAIAIVQGFAASTSGLVAFARKSQLDRQVILFGGGFVAIGALIGGVVSDWVSELILLIVFSVFTGTTAALMALPRKELDDDSYRPFTADRSWRLSIFFPGGMLAGMVGVGGGVLTVPILHRILNIPLKKAVGSSMGMTWLAVTFGMVGKAITGQIPIMMAIVTAIGAVLGAQLGVRINQFVPPRYLRRLFIALLGSVSVRTLFDIMERF